MSTIQDKVLKDCLIKWDKEALEKTERYKKKFDKVEHSTNFELVSFFTENRRMNDRHEDQSYDWVLSQIERLKKLYGPEDNMCNHC